ncbi:MAG: universal stress protein [Ruminococcaceae bacterium]|jgi:nucleotide-binding universal stress UspA family protein|nr:universal stress protein [Oscillospiraceae bacterium]
MKKIFVPIDGSECANAALDKAIELAKIYESELTLLYVDEDPDRKTIATPAVAGGSAAATPNVPDMVAGQAGTGAFMHVAKSDQMDETSETADKILSKAKSRASVLLKPVITVSMSGNPSDVITEFVNNSDFDLVVIGCSSKTGLKKFLLGSVADRVTRSVRKSVLIVR